MTVSAAEPLRFLGAPGSPYTRKMLALLRFRRIPHAVIWGGHTLAPAGYPEPKVKLLPTFYFPGPDGALAAVTDSTPIIRRLEAERPDRGVLPTDPLIAFLNDLIEDYADEWLTKAMFHYRWAFAADAANAGPLLIHWSMPGVKGEAAAAAAKAISERQINRLYVVGSNAVTAATIEASYERFIDLLDAAIAARGYLLGARPASADFAVYGQLTQLGQVDPTPARLLEARSPRVRAWIDRMEDLSGLEPGPGDWLRPQDAGEALGPLLAEIGRVYAPALLANAAAIARGAESFETVIDGRPWTQPTFPYQAKCLAALRAAFAALPAPAQASAAALLDAAGAGAFKAQSPDGAL